jgi:hypothetical protein
MAVDEEIIIGGIPARDPGHEEEEEEISGYNGQYDERGNSGRRHG